MSNTLKKANKNTKAIMDYLEQRGCKEEFVTVPQVNMIDSVGITIKNLGIHLRFLEQNGYIAKMYEVNGNGKRVNSYKIIKDLPLDTVLKLSDSRFRGDKCTNPKEVAHIARHFITNDLQEHFIVFNLDNKSRVMSVKLMYLGTSDEISISPKEIMRDAIKDNAYSMIVVHNHPSGDITPSQADISSTKRLAEISRLVGVNLLDHIIVTNDDYSSMRQDDPEIFN